MQEGSIDREKSDEFRIRLLMCDHDRQGTEWNYCKCGLLLFQFLQKIRRKISRTNQTCWKMMSWFWMTKLGPTLVRLSVNCWTDTAGRCYPIRPRSPTWVSRTSTCSQNWKSTCVVWVSLRWRKYLPPLHDTSDSSNILHTWLVSWTFQNVRMHSFERRETTLKDCNTFPNFWCSIL